MFYSHVYLARKGPLGTVWAAAHLQQRLKKSHYTATNIPKTVGSCFLPIKLAPFYHPLHCFSVKVSDFSIKAEDS